MASQITSNRQDWLQILLTSASELQPFSLYVSNRGSSDSNTAAVVGSATHSSQWRIVRYDISHPKRMGSLESYVISAPIRERQLQVGTCVRFFHLESNSWLRYGTTGSTSSAPGQVTLQYYGDRDIKAGLTGDLSIDSLWEIERPTVYEGGIVKWSDTVAFRHVVTGQYLAISSIPMSPAMKKRSPVATQFSSDLCGHTIAQLNPQSFRFVATALADEE